ncbi:hypothetical protein [Actinomycetospora soli]|uniref:hypothetical protein n=1 Tax=Actinomycetospora soli TaxID=2893887 RepID=UPI001E397D59|nr:hypothetical protein [Actinomycetospora soli]MCD2191351.1 hypothetical protein [Actinomycetospora soli]
MTFVPLVQAWEASREERTPMPARQRVASIDYGSGVPERPATLLDWLLDRDRHEAEIDDEEREVGA